MISNTEKIKLSDRDEFLGEINHIFLFVRLHAIELLDAGSRVKAKSIIKFATRGYEIPVFIKFTIATAPMDRDIFNWLERD